MDKMYRFVDTVALPSDRVQSAFPTTAGVQ
jgi:hypothetical protein